MRHLILLLFLIVPLTANCEPLVFPNSAVVPNDKPYFIKHSDHSEIIYSEDNKDTAEYTLGFEKRLLPLYNQAFGYQLDSKLSVGLISDRNQIANGFSTQYPNNRQINYMGGAQSIDYFASPSWLDTLLLHETAHNYQTNAKASPITQGIHTVARNGMILFPVFATPNAFESSFILEGNAVLNESWHGKGGRLYSGRYRAMYHAHSQAGYLTKSRLYNNTLNFPFAEGHYIFGGFYQAFLAERYGVNLSNYYFWQRSKTWYYPFTINTPTQRTFGKNFNTLFSEWKLQSEKISQAFNKVNGTVIGRSKFYSEISKANQQLLFISNSTGTEHPLLHRYDLASNTVKTSDTHLDSARLFSINNTLYSVSSRHTSPEKISQGLFDDQGMILEQTAGKVIQGYLNDQTPVYFKTSESFRSPQLYVGNEYYGEVHSSVLVHENNLYYFKQNNQQRVLYRNNQALVGFPGFYSIISDVDSQGRIYFIANTPLGSGLYRYGKDGIEKVLSADNILSAKLINDRTALVTALSAEDYYFSVVELTPRTMSPYIVEYFWDKQDLDFNQDVNSIEPVTIAQDKPYTFSNSIDYAAGSLFTQKGDEENTLFNAAFTFSDPLTYHSLTLFAQRDADLTTQAGVSYGNNQHLLRYGLKAYGIIENGFEEIEQNNPFIETRSYGIGVDLQLPLMKEGFWNVSAHSGYFQDYKNLEREPISLSLDINNVKAFGTSMYLNEGFDSKLYGVRDREQNIFGGKLTLYTSGPWQTYANAGFQYSHYDGDVNVFYREGIVLSKALDFFGNDPSGLVMPSLYRDSLATQASKAEINISKVLDTSAYGFWFPASLRRQSLTLSYRYFDLHDVSRYVPELNVFGDFGDIQIQQAAAALELDTLFFHKFPIRIKIEALWNDDERVTEQQQTNLSVAVPF